MGEVRVPHKRILLADDDAGVRQAIKFLLRIDGHVVSEAENGREALELFKRESFDLVIVDWVMPEMDGCELAKNIKSLVPSQPVIMITGWANRFTGWEMEANALMNKPFVFADLRKAIAKVTS